MSPSGGNPSHPAFPNSNVLRGTDTSPLAATLYFSFIDLHEYLNSFAALHSPLEFMLNCWYAVTLVLSKDSFSLSCSFKINSFFECTWKSCMTEHSSRADTQTIKWDTNESLSRVKNSELRMIKYDNMKS